MHRAGNVIQVPGGYGNDVNFLYSSDDGGKTFTGPGIIGTLGYDTGTVVYGSGIQSIGVLGTTATTLSSDDSNEYFQGTPAAADRDYLYPDGLESSHPNFAGSRPRLPEPVPAECRKARPATALRLCERGSAGSGRFDDC